MNHQRNALCALVAVATAFAPATLADHSWGNYHWARTTSSFDLTVINSTTSEWDGYVTVVPRRFAYGIQNCPGHCLLDLVQ